MIDVVASLMCGNWLNLGRDMEQLEQAGVDGFHLDVMDSVFVPNFSMNLWMIKQVRDSTKLPLDVHIMTHEPIRFVDKLADIGVDTITVHAESTVDLESVVRGIKKRGVKAGVALNPETDFKFTKNRMEDTFSEIDLFLFMMSRPGFMGQKFRPEVCDKISRARAVLKEENMKPVIMADGAVGLEVIPSLAKVGVDTYVGGTSGLFIKDTSFKENIENLKSSAKEHHVW